MNTKITKHCSITPSRTTLLGYLPKHSSFLLPPQHPNCTIAFNSINKNKVFPVTAVFTQCTCAQNYSLQRNGTSKQNCPHVSCNFFNKDCVWDSSKVRHFDNKHVFSQCIPGKFLLTSSLIAKHALNVLMTHFCKAKPTCNDVIDALWPCRTAKGAQVRRHQTRIILSQLPAAIMVFS